MNTETILQCAILAVSFVSLVLDLTEEPSTDEKSSGEKPLLRILTRTVEMAVSSVSQAPSLGVLIIELIVKTIFLAIQAKHRLTPPPKE